MTRHDVARAVLMGPTYLVFGVLVVALVALDVWLFIVDWHSTLLVNCAICGYLLWTAVREWARKTLATTPTTTTTEEDTDGDGLNI